MVYRHVGPPDVGDLESGERTCRVCSEWKDIRQFHWANGRKYRRRTCKSCIDARRREDIAANPKKYADRSRAAALKRKYGLAPSQFDELLVEQNYRCAICWIRLTNDSTHVDHDHSTGAVRGLLCTNCNLGLGHFRDDQSRLRQAIAYLSSIQPLEDVA